MKSNGIRGGEVFDIDRSMFDMKQVKNLNGVPVFSISRRTCFIIILTALFLLPGATALTVEELVNSYDYDFLYGTFNVTGFVDIMVDTNLNGVNDSLLLTFNFTPETSSNFTFVVDLVEKDGLVTNFTRKEINFPIGTITVGIKTDLLTFDRWNYTLSVYNNSEALVYRKYRAQTKVYSNYEKGLELVSIADENVNNNQLRLNITVNLTTALTTNVTVVMQYDANLTISRKEEKTLSSGISIVQLNFDNETIKSTHHNGAFKVIKVAVGQKVFQQNFTTLNNYDYENFATTSYIKNFTDRKVDLNNNNLSDYLQVNFSLNIKEANNYTISADLFDGTDSFVTGMNQTKDLSIGLQIVTFNISGQEIYKTKLDGPYVLKNAKVVRGSITDDLRDIAYTTNQTFFTDYERPPLPDLSVQLNVTFNAATNISRIIINLSNIGNVTAFNVFLDIFDNTTFAQNQSLDKLDNGTSQVYEYNHSNSTKRNIYTTIADFNNVIDELNESNNIAQHRYTFANLTSFTRLKEGGYYNVFEFVSVTNQPIANFTWQLDTGQVKINSSRTVETDTNYTIWVWNEYNYTIPANYTAIASVIDGDDAESIFSYAGELLTFGLRELLNLTFNNTRAFEFQVENIWNNTKLFNWTFDSGDGLHDSNESKVIEPEEPPVFIWVNHSYSQNYSGPIKATALTNLTNSSNSTNI